MKPTEITHEYGQLYVDAPYHPEITARLKSVGGLWDPTARRWQVDERQGDKLLNLLPKASYSYEALCVCFEAEDARARRFVANLHSWNITLTSDGERVTLHGPSVSPLLQQVADNMAAALLRVELVLPPREAAPRPQATLPMEATTLETAYVTGMHNAAEAEQQAQARATRARMARRRRMEQAELWG